MNYYDLIHSESFKKWFGDWEKAYNEAGLNFNNPAWKGVSKAVNDSGMPIVLYHGTTHEWTKYSRKLGNHENDMGIGFYATSEAYDAQQNYLAEGKDLTNKISYLAEHYSQTKKVNVEKAKEIIERKYKGKTEKIIEVFLNIKRPLIISMSGKVTDGTYFDFSPTIDEDEQYTDSKELIKFREAFDEVCEDFNLNQTQCGRIWSGFYENIGELYDYVSAYKLITALKGAEWLHEYTYDEEVGSKSYEFVSQVFQKMGFDGVIYKDASEHFKGLDMPKGTKHFIAFKATQIKLADGTNTTFNPRSTDIRFNEGGVTDTLEKTAEINNDLIINITKSPEFKSWFGDWENDPENSSKMLNEKGEPLICFHGTNEEFNVFRSDYIGAYHDEGFYGKGFYFTFQRESKNIQWAISEALYYGKRLIPVFLNVRNPFNFRNLSKYKGVDINYLGTQTMVFLYNIAKMFPYLSDNIFIEKSTWNEKEQHYDITKLPISILPELIEKYSNELKTYIIDRDGTKYVKGYVKSKIVEYDYTASGGSKGSYEDREDLNGFIDFELGKYQTEALEIIFIEKALEKYHGLKISYFVEGYMTRNPQITEAIKQNHDGIIQSENGDEVVVFEPNQIKLADGTNTTFDANNDDIRFDKGGLIIEPNERIEWNGYKVGDIIESEELFELSGGSEGGKKGKKYILTQELLSNLHGTIQDIYDNVDNEPEYMSGEDFRIKKMKSNFSITPPIPYTGDGLHRIVSAKELGHKTILMWKEYNPDIMFNDGGEIKKYKSFKTNEGNFSIYDIEKYPVGRASYFTVFEDKNGWIIRNSILPDNMKRKGIATNFYLKMNQESIKRTGKPLRSTQKRILESGEVVHELSDDGISLWDSFVKKGYAEKIGYKDYVFYKF